MSATMESSMKTRHEENTWQARLTASIGEMNVLLPRLWLLSIPLAALPLCAETTEANGYTWAYRIADDTAEICNGYDAAVSPSPTGAVSIPSTLDGYPVTSIGDWAFADCAGLTNVTIPDSVTNIGWAAFYGCIGLTSITIPDSVTKIEHHAFYNCYELTSVAIGNGVTRIEENTFELCSSLVRVTMGNGVTSIGDGAFSGCSDLASITIPNNDNPIYSSRNGLLLTKDGQTLVQGVNGDVTIPDGITSIGAGAFDGRSGLTSVQIGAGVTNIGDRAFHGCSDLASVRLPDSVTDIGDGAFSECTRLGSVTIGTNVTSIGEQAFYNCSRLESVTLPERVTRIEPETFNGCSRLESVKIGSAVTFIGYNAFASCGSLASVTIPHGVTDIEAEAFSDCSRLTSVTIPHSATNIGDWAFYGCSSLRMALAPCALEDDINDREVFLDCAPDIQIVYYGDDDIPFAMGGDANWTQEQDGSWKSGSIGDNQKTWIETTVSGRGSLSFKWKVSSQPGRDKLCFYLDGVLQMTISGTRDWTEDTYEVPTEGFHALRWLYKKDGSVSNGYDCGWVDAVTWTPGSTAPAGVEVEIGDGKTVTVPNSWLVTHESIVRNHGGDAVAALKSTALNGRLSVVECYVLGLDPEDPDADFRITSFPMGADGMPNLDNIAFDPPQAEWNVQATHRVIGATTPNGPWQEVPAAGNAAYRFFKVRLVLP